MKSVSLDLRRACSWLTSADAHSRMRATTIFSRRGTNCRVVSLAGLASSARSSEEAFDLCFCARASDVGCCAQLEADMVEFHQAEAGWMESLPDAPTFRPTVAQFADPLAYIRSIQKEAAAAGGPLRTALAPLAMTLHLLCQPRLHKQSRGLGRGAQGASAECISVVVRLSEPFKRQC